MNRLYFGNYCSHNAGSGPCLNECNRFCEYCGKPFCSKHLKHSGVTGQENMVCPTHAMAVMPNGVSITNARKYIKPNESSKQTHPMHKTWDVLLRLESGLDHFIAGSDNNVYIDPKTPGVEVSYATAEDNELPEGVIVVQIYVKRKCSANEFNDWYNRDDRK